MHHPALVLPILLPLAAGALLPSFNVPRNLFANSARNVLSSYNIPTAHESAILARRILNLTPLGTLSTVFPSPHSSTERDDAASLNARPQSLAGVPIGMMDYVADCESNGNPTILAISIATTFRNAAAGSNVSLALQWTPPHPPSKRISFSVKDPVPYSAANLPRFSLLGHLESISEDDINAGKVADCFVKAHPDAKYWLPGNRIHSSEWVRLVVDGLYWVGGFGDRAYIGWIDKDDYSKVTKEEWASARLPGEKKGWKEWAIEEFGSWEL